MTVRSSEGYRKHLDLHNPPLWAESLLMFLLKPRDRESIPGDLIEEYREARLPLLGQARANLWYVRQVFNIAASQHFEGGPMKGILLFLCFLTLAAMTWFCIMEIILHHPGSALRICVAVLLASQSLSTILFLIFRGHGRIQIVLKISGFVIAIFGIYVVVSISRAAHFEGYLLLIGLALILQGAFTIAAPAFSRDGAKSGGHLLETHSAT